MYVIKKVRHITILCFIDVSKNETGGSIRNGTIKFILYTGFIKFRIKLEYRKNIYIYPVISIFLVFKIIMESSNWEKLKISKSCFLSSDRSPFISVNNMPGRAEIRTRQKKKDFFSFASCLLISMNHGSSQYLVFSGKRKRNSFWLIILIS